MGRRLLLAGLLAGVALAEDLLTPGEQVAKELSAALTAEDATEAVPLIEEAADIYLQPCGAAEAASLLSLLGTAAKSAKKEIAAAALRALGRTGSAAAVPLVEPFLRAVKKGEEPLAIAAAEAAGRLAAGNLIPNLLDLGRDCPDLVVAEQALLALGGYVRAERDVRERAFREVLSVAQTLSKKPPRWQRLEWPCLRALQRLSGKRLNSVEQFADWWRVAKSRKEPFG
ncbi:MAG TPA: hypothetical protein VFY93_01930 [Planctomycetota bacterium]|nr:hypothetical protein [Planctomycetota bacterium]